MSPLLIACKASRDYTLWCKFSDGLQGTVNVAGMLDIGCFTLWRDLAIFLDARPCPDTGDAWWPAGVRIDRWVLYSELEARGARPAQPARDIAFQRFMARAISKKNGPRGATR